MKNTLKTLILLLFISVQISAQTPALTIPGFNFCRPDKSSFSNKNLEPGKMSFFFFFDSDCDHCQHAMMNLNQHYNDYKKTAIYLISLDDQQKINRFVNSYAPKLKGKENVTLLMDTKNEFIKKFQPRKYPSMFLYSPDKKLIDYEDNEESMFRFSKHLNTPVK